MTPRSAAWAPAPACSPAAPDPRAESARYLEIPLGLVQAAIAYYGAYTAEIDQQIEDNEQEATEAYQAYQAGQVALRR